MMEFEFVDDLEAGKFVDWAEARGIPTVRVDARVMVDDLDLRPGVLPRVPGHGRRFGPLSGQLGRGSNPGQNPPPRSGGRPT